MMTVHELSERQSCKRANFSRPHTIRGGDTRSHQARQQRQLMVIRASQR